MAKHTPEPWREDDDAEGLRPMQNYIMGGPDSENPNGYVIGQTGFTDNDEEDEANAARIVQCVNACAGMEDPVAYERAAIEQAREAIQRVLMVGEIGEYVRNELKAALADLSPKQEGTEQRSEMVCRACGAPAEYSGTRKSDGERGRWCEKHFD